MSIEHNYNIRKPTPLFRLWLAFFIYTVLVALTLQLVLLPYVFPAWHAGNGLLIGGDWLVFHQQAVEMQQKIHVQGWSAWELRPEGQAPAGIAAAIYSLTVPKPWTVIPLNAALHATSALVLLRILQFLIPYWKRTVFFVLPFLLYPSAMTWYTQNHKDGFFFTGAFLFIYGLLLLYRLETWNSGWRTQSAAVSMCFLGCILVWIVRPYGVQLLQAVGILISLLIAGAMVNRGLRRLLSWPKVVASLLLLCIMLAGITPLIREGITAEVPKVPEVPKVSEVPKASETPKVSEVPKSSEIPNVPEVPKVSEATPGVEFWKKSGWLPSFLENNLYTLSISRDGSRLGYPDAGSNIDVDISFHSAVEIIRYLPRAAQIVFLAPFPDQWLGQAKLESNTMMRRIAAFEMTGVYFSFVFLPYALWHWRKRLEIWMLLIFSSGLMLIYGLSIPNIGTLYRMRYGFIMILVALGLAGFFEARKAYLTRRQNTVLEREAGSKEITNDGNSMRKIKILQVCAVDFTLKNLLLPLVDKLSREGFYVHTVCSPGPEVEELKAGGYSITTIQIMRRISPLKNFVAMIKLFRFIKKEKFDVVHVHTPVAAIVGRVAAKLAGVPLVIYTAHGFYFHDQMSRWKRELFIGIEKLMGKYFTDIIFTQSEEDRETAAQRRIIEPARMYRIGNGVNLQNFNPDNTGIPFDDKRRELSISQDAQVIGFIGRIVKEKGIVDLVQAFKYVLKESPKAVLLIIGDHLSSDRDLTTKNEVLSLIKKYNLTDKIIFTGYRRDIKELLAITDVFVLPSYREGMPRSIIEAMAMAKPVVATNIRGCREEVVDGRTGFLVPVGDQERLSVAILKILQNDRLAGEMGRKGLARARSKFDEQRVLEKQVSLIRKCLEKQGNLKGFSTV